ncbi:extracellular solute-binding protein [Ahrensia kielensis]|uniref:Extracellular solute-binding protein n=1 Tax=Ahrensia kielensis TaxID=76980 RepID=A0ABU9T439_9HYPH
MNPKEILGGKKMQATKMRYIIGCMVTSLIASIAGSASAQSIEFFQTKPEAVVMMNALIADFEAEYPDIHVTQVQTPEPDTVLRSRIVRGNLPDLIALGGDRTFADLAEAGVLMELSDTPLLDSIQPTYLEMLNDLHGEDGQYGIPYTANANTVLYNTEIFAENGWSVPTTWTEFIALAEDAKSKGVTPLYLTFLDQWTTMIPFNAIAANIQPAGFIAARRAGDSTFASAYASLPEKMSALLTYGQNDIFGRSYDDGNRAMAQGEAAMLLQGPWAIPAIRSFNPNAPMGTFAFPVTDDANANKLVSGVDTVLAISRQTPNVKAARSFIEFLLRPENAVRFIDDQKQFSAIEGVIQKDPIFSSLIPFFEQGRITSFPDHYFPAGMQVDTLVQEFLLDPVGVDLLARLDKEWDLVAAR